MGRSSGAKVIRRYGFDNIPNAVQFFFHLDETLLLLGDEEVLIVPTAETVKQSFFLELSLAQEMPLAMVGHTGTGKSFVTNSFIRKLSKDKYITNVINFSARTTVNYTQVCIFTVSFLLLSISVLCVTVSCSSSSSSQLGCDYVQVGSSSQGSVRPRHGEEVRGVRGRPQSTPDGRQ